MKQSDYLSAVAVMQLSFTGCMSAQGRLDDPASGSFAAGAAGVIIGGMARRPGPGVLIGALIGHGLDQSQEAQLRVLSPLTLQRVEQSQPLTVADIVSLSQAGIGNDLVISQIRNSRTVYYLTTADIIDLNNAGVSARIIDFMINTPARISSAETAGVVGTAPPAPLHEQIEVAPGPDYVWVGGAWFWLGDRWIWQHGYWHQPAYSCPPGPRAYDYR